MTGLELEGSVGDARVARTLHRLDVKVAGGEYYEAHQMLRTVVIRYLHSKSYQLAIELLSKGALVFLKAQQGGSGTDLIFYLLEVYDTGDVAVSDESRARLVPLLMELDCNEPNLKDVIIKINNWSINHGDCKFGDPYLHHIMGLKLLDGGYIYESERYLMLGTHDSMLRHVDLLWDWFLQGIESEGVDNGISQVGDYLSRLIFNYLFIRNISFGYESQNIFLQKFIERFQPRFETMNKNGFEIAYFQDFQELNYLQLLFITCRTGKANLFNNLNSHYSILKGRYESELVFLANEYFGIVPPKQVNFLQDMMAGFLGGGGAQPPPSLKR